MIAPGLLAFGLVVLFGALGSARAEKIDLVLREGTNFAAALSPTDGSFVLDLQGTLWRLPAEGGPATAMTISALIRFSSFSGLVRIPKISMNFIRFWMRDGLRRTKSSWILMNSLD